MVLPPAVARLRTFRPICTRLARYARRSSVSRHSALGDPIHPLMCGGASSDGWSGSRPAPLFNDLDTRPATVEVVQRTELVVVRVIPTRMWHALVDDEVAGKAHVLRRPDRRYFVAIDAWRNEVFDALLDAVVHDLPHELSTIADEADDGELARWTRRGFEERRREDEYEIPLHDPGRHVAPVPAGYSLISAADADVDALRRLDDDLRQAVPGTRGWVNDPDEFVDQTLHSTLFHPATHLVGVEEASGAYAGLVRVRVARRWAKLGLVGVRAGHRRRGLGRAMVAAALQPLPDRGVKLVLAEADAASAPSQALLASFDARRTGGTIELVRDAST
jgi:GNAT superfamily N-acetyltransferase